MKDDQKSALDDLVAEAERYLTRLQKGRVPPVIGHPNKTIVQYLRTMR